MMADRTRVYLIRKSVDTGQGILLGTLGLLAFQLLIWPAVEHPRAVQVHIPPQTPPAQGCTLQAVEYDYVQGASQPPAIMVSWQCPPPPKAQ